MTTEPVTILATVHRGGKGKLSLHTNDQRALESFQGRNLKVLIQDTGKAGRSPHLRKSEPMDVIIDYCQEVKTLGEGINLTELFTLVWDETGRALNDDELKEMIAEVQLTIASWGKS
ncbi:MAG TPA: hypothetical protein VI727_04075 [Candidatus Brocadiaceae bacterium]|nr:hypothetical protein [Candidatus Brocadiaceae bacterium]